MRRLRKAPVLLVAMLMFWHTALFAAQWQVHPRLILAEIYSDNITLAPPGTEESDFVTEITPGISLNGQGARLKLNINFDLQNLIYASNGDFNATNPRLAASASAELVKHIFFVDARSSYGQQIVNTNGRYGLDNVNPGNRANVFTYGLSPYLKLHFGSYADGEVRFSDDHVENQSPTISDAETQHYTANIHSGTRFVRLQWGITYDQQDLNRYSGPDTHYENGEATLRYHLLSSWSLLGIAGYEDNQVPNIVDPRNGSYWSAGVGWSPSKRFSLSAAKGENNLESELFFEPIDRTSLRITYNERDVGLIIGPSWNATFSHYTRRTTWRASYLEETTATQILQASGQQFFVLVDSQGNPIVDPNTGLPVVLVQNVFSLTNQDFLRQRGQFSVTMKTGKSDIVFSVYDENRIYSPPTNQSEEVIGPMASWTWRFAPRTSTMIGGGWQRRNPVGTDLHEDYWNGSIVLMRTISRDVNASLGYSHFQRNSYDASNEYAENRVTIQLNMQF